MFSKGSCRRLGVGKVLRNTAGYVGRITIAWIVWLALSFAATPAIAGASYVQGNSAANASATSSIAATYNSAQLNSDLNIVVVTWQTGATVSSVVDQSGNSYSLAIGPTADGFGGLQSIYYAANITAATPGANAVTVSFTSSTTSGLRIVEYNGISTVNPLDVAGGAVCSAGSSWCNSGSINTTNSADLLVGVNEVNASHAGAGYTERLDSATYGMIVEDQVVYTTGTYSASVQVSAPAAYVTQLVAFKVASTGAYVQGNSTISTSAVSSLAASFNSAQLNGDLNIVVVTWQQGVSISAVTDQSGNTYQLAIGPSSDGAVGVQSIYYAANIGAAPAGANFVTVTFNGSSASGGLRVVEYTGISASSPLDAAGAAVCATTATRCSSGSITTTHPADLLIGVNEANATGPGRGYTERFDTATFNMIIEDRTVTATGTYSASVNVSSAGNYVTQIVAFKIASGDSIPPTAPSGLAVSSTSPSQIGLSWTASTDNVGIGNYLLERCQGATCSTFAQIGTVNGTSYLDSGLAAGTSYTYRIRATDQAGNLSAYSGSVSASTSSGTDTQAPTVPGSLNATATSSNEVALSWSASSDNVGVSAYLIERCQAECSSYVQIGTATATTYTDDGVIAGATYSYRVRARDGSANTSDYSNVASVTTPSGSDTQAPTAPSSVSATTASGSAIQLAWTASTDNVGVTGYLIEGCSGSGCTSFSQLASAASSPFTVAGLAANTHYTFRLRATDAAGNLSAYSNLASAVTGPGGGSICD